MNFAAQNLKYLRKQKSWTQDELASALNIKRSLVGAYEEERADPRLEVQQQICEMFHISFEDFLFKDLSESGQSYLQQRRAAKMLQASPSSIIHLVPIKAAAGYLAGYADTGFIDELNTFTLPMLAPGNYRAFEIIGDSMLPTPSGSIIVGEQVQNVEDVKASHTYIVVSRTEGIVYKRVEKNSRSKQITLTSDNPAYPPYQIDAKEIMEMWKAQMVISKPSTSPRYDMAQLATVVDTLQNQVDYLKKRVK